MSMQRPISPNLRQVLLHIFQNFTEKKPKEYSRKTRRQTNMCIVTGPRGESSVGFFRRQGRIFKKPKLRRLLFLS